jgi:hypothetical protein
MRQIYLKEYDCFGYETQIDVEVNQDFIEVLSDDQLNRLFESTIEHEEYEMSKLLHNEIMKRHVQKLVP